MSMLFLGFAPAELFFYSTTAITDIKYFTYVIEDIFL